jgi:threonine dehydrogenase-like Zn-dependent dehydrogenase
VEGFEVGDRVVSEQIVPCGKCLFCRTGRYWMCQPHDVYGFKTQVNGGMAEYVLLPKNALNYKVPKEIPADSAVLIEPFACSKHCVDRAPITNTDVVVLAGAGTLGLGMVGAACRQHDHVAVGHQVRLDRERHRAVRADGVSRPRSSLGSARNHGSLPCSATARSSVRLRRSALVMLAAAQ